MAVPSSGSLSMQSLAQECLYGTYGSGTITGPISMYNLVNGGNTGGGATSGNTYPTVNTGCIPNPANRNSNQLTSVSGAMGTSTPVTLYYNSNIGAASNLGVGDYLYTDSSLSTPATSADFYASSQPGETGNATRHCNTGDDWLFDIDNNQGRISGDYGCQ